MKQIIKKLNINPSKIKLIVVLLFLIIIFHTPFENTLNKLLVNPFFSYVDDDSLPNAIIFIVTISGLLIVLRKNFINKKIPSLHFLINLSVITILYSWYRCFTDIWIYKGFSFFDCRIYYLDAILILFFLYLIFFIFYLFSETSSLEKDSLFIAEDSDIIPKVDLLGRDNYASRIAQEAINVDSKSAFAIGINGEWGSGKTFFLSLIEKHLPDNVIKLNFNPWKSGSPDLVINDFFELFSSKLEEHNSELSSELNQYVKDIIPVQEGIIQSFLNQGIELFFDKVSYDKIDKEIERLGKRIIVFIDDLDRLNKEEIVEVIRLIRNTANFGNVIFIVAYDRSYVLNAIKDYNGHQHGFFLEKIFQLEVPLPVFEELHLKSLFLEIIKTKVENNVYITIKTLLSDNVNEDKLMVKILPTIRDIIRFANLFVLDNSFTRGEIDIKDFFYVQILKLKYPKLYTWIYVNKNLLFKQKENNDVVSYAYMKTSEGFGTLIQKVNSMKEYFAIPNDKLNDVESILSVLFEVKFFTPMDLSKIFSIKHISSFHKYFTPELFASDLSEEEFNDTMKMGIEEIKVQFDDWIDSGKSYRLVERLKISRRENSLWYNNRLNYEKMIELHFYIVRQDYGIMKDLHYKINNQSGEISKRYYDKEKELFHAFILKMFQKYETVQFARYLIRTKQSLFILSKNELKSIILNAFSKLLKEQEKIKKQDWNAIWDSYHSNHFIADRKENNLISADANRIFISFIRNGNLINFLRKIILDRHNNYSLSRSVGYIFGNYEKFEKFLKEEEKKYKENVHFDDFMIFFNAYKSNDFYELENFSFSVLLNKGN